MIDLNKLHKYNWIWDSSERFTEKNPVLKDDEIGYEKDKDKLKIGDGVTPWNELKYFNQSSGNGGGSGAELEEDIRVIDVEQGSLKNGDVVSKDTDYTTLMKMLLQKAVPASYSAPTISLSIAPATVQEKGTEVAVVCTPGFIKRDAGDFVKYILYKNNVKIHESETPTPYTDPAFTITENTTYKVTVYYAEGPIKNDNMGNPSPNGHILAGSSSATRTLNAVAASYRGIINTVNPTEAEIKALTKDIKELKGYTWNGITANDAHICYAYPASLGNLTSIKDDNNFEYIGSYTKLSITIDNTPYNVYVLTNSTTVNGFKQIYS